MVGTDPGEAHIDGLTKLTSSREKLHKRKVRRGCILPCGSAPAVDGAARSDGQFGLLAHRGQQVASRSRTETHLA